MKIVEGNITVTYSVTCPCCDKYMNTDHDNELRQKIADKSEYWFCDFDESTDNLEVNCPQCKKKFVIDKFTHLTTL